MDIKIIAVGKLKERFWKDACAEYAKRLTRYVKLEVIEVDDCGPARHGGDEKAKAAEAEAILRHLPAGKAAGRHIVTLEIKGRELTSEQLASFVEDRGIEGCRELVFIIGGSTGLDPSITRMANTHLSFGKITLPHNLARFVLLEQLYRAQRIIKGEPYHK
ncbi:MAG: 23S rRNA (pseudouridine(1915)-N(3))-methyltransferase RlmH [Coriobacteriales bacterium]|jgi:23S rRNA (pseudouridine1915-N3)-methyltransferase